MLKKRLGIEMIEINWDTRIDYIYDYFKIPSILIIPEGCVSIGRSIFWKCKGLKKVEIPESVKIIGNNAFLSCENANIILEKPMRAFKHVGNYAFEGCKSVEYAKEKTRN